MGTIQDIAEYFNTRAATWDDTSDKPSVKHIGVAMLAGVGEGKRVLDIGCGTGIMAEAYMACNAREVVALDASPEMISRATAKFAHCDHMHFTCADVLAYTDDAPFDVVVIYNAYPHLLDKPALVKNVASLLAPGGRFLVAHGAGRATINARHHMVPENVTSDLLSAQEHARDWEDVFRIDTMVDSDTFYAFGGTLK